jgi:hypothetical protein
MSITAIASLTTATFQSATTSPSSAAWTNAWSKPLVMFCGASRLLRDFSGTWRALRAQNQQRFVEPLGVVIDISVLGISAPNI